MYLKSIEIQGFKSFANKIIFEFHNGITGIVGPNGSWKSNVADAVRWVLGEQRVKQLRGGSMQDVIFSGTETRRPQGFAYVAITLDNSDHQLAIEYDEVTVSRRLYRSGESEYLINGSACRLKDINELFYDTGIGKEGYSIIGQGQIDKILSGKPEERRELFDEAAGIVKFKRRKSMAQKSLEDEKQNLLRVTDILAELEKQVGPLRRQSESAKEYLRLREELKLYDANLFLLDSEQIREQIREMEKKGNIVCQDMEESKKTQEAMRQDYEALAESLHQMEEQIRESRQQWNDANMDQSRLEGQINVLKEQIRAEHMQREHIKNRQETIEKELANKKKEKEQVSQRQQELLEELAIARACLEEAEQKKNRQQEQVSALEQKIERDKACMMELFHEKASLNARWQRYEAMLEQVQVRRAEVSQRLLRAKTQENSLDLQIQEQKKELESADEKIKEILEEKETTKSILEELEEENRKCNRRLQEAQHQYHANATKLESLKNIAERYEGYGNSIRRVMEVKDRIRGIHGVVADLVSSEKQYETAIETALGGSIQNIVTDSEETAKQLIAYLKKNRYGRATFLPLTSIGNKNAFHQMEALKEPGVLGLAHTLVKADVQYEGLLKYLLGRVVVVDTIDHAIALARKYQYSLRIVTLEGELLNAGGSMTGGAFKNNSNLLGRRREIEEMEQNCKKAVMEVEKIQKEIALGEELLQVQKEELDEIRKQEQDAYLEKNTKHMAMEQLEKKKADLLDGTSDLVRENRQLEEQIQEICDSQKTLQEEMETYQDDQETLQGQVEQSSYSLEQERAAREPLNRQVSEAQLQVAGLEQNRNFLSETMERMKEEEQRLLDEKTTLEDGTKNAKDAVKEKEQEIEQISQKIQERSTQQIVLAERAKEQEEQKKLAEEKQRHAVEQREHLGNQINGLDKEMFRLESQKEKLEERLNSLVSYMWNEYELSLQTAEALRRDEWREVSFLRQNVEERKEKIRGLGHVNVQAIEDFREVEERYTFMKTQHDDLVSAENALLKVIEELDAGMRKQFEEKFGEIRAEFDRVFREMFGGGHGELELMDGDILETGIQIISQPPGKKLQNMMQLSGGEKALTAIALLFAIQNLKPSPFCLLDEIEAALDDSNVDRFAKYLHKLTKHTQFIVITHRRGTMVSADRLYGITMQEKGVSTLVSVNLIEEELDRENAG